MTMVAEYAPARVIGSDAAPGGKQKLTAEEKITELRNVHVHFNGKCVLDGEPWPCLTRQMIDD